MESSAQDVGDTHLVREQDPAGGTVASQCHYELGHMNIEGLLSQQDYQLNLHMALEDHLTVQGLVIFCTRTCIQMCRFETMKAKGGNRRNNF